MKIYILLLFLFFNFPVFAQNYEFGNLSELKGKKKISVNAGAALESRARIINEIEKAKLPVEIIDSAIDAEVFLVFRVGIIPGSRYEKQIETEVGTFTSFESDKEAGVGGVFIVSRSTRRLRQLLDFRDVQRMPLERRPATNFAKEFIKAYKTANGLE